MFGKMMNSFYYGKSGKGDFRKEDLPQNRWQLFWAMLRVRFSALCRLNLMYMLAWLPMMLVIMMTVLGWFSSMSIAVEVGTPEAYAEFASTQQSLLFTGLLMLIPCIAITGPFTAGASYVTRNWARDEHAFVWSDFKDAVKANWKQGLAVSTITGVMPFLLYVCWTFYGQMSQQQAFFIVPQVLTLMLGLVWSLAVIYLYPLMVTYKLRFRDLLRNGLMLSVGRLPQSVGLRLLSILPAAIGIGALLIGAPAQWVIFALFIYYLLIGYSLSRFGYASYSNAVFDKYINARMEGVEINRGLNQELDDDDDDDEDEDETY